jgi:hypothetical protein
MVFPHDFFQANTPIGMQAIRAFSESEVCNGQKALALLDGGLYDNLGLASIEDIRNFVLSQHQSAKGEGQPSQGRDQDDAGARNADARSPFVVIATDVDNIQPSLSFYEAIQENHEAELPTRVSFRQGFLMIAVRSFKRSIALALIVPAIPLAAVSKLIGMKLLDEAVPNALKTLGFSETFVADKSKKDQKSLHLILSLRRLFFNNKAKDHRKDLLQSVQNNLLHLRLSQLTPTISGYLKRTRSLTYGYLQTNYEQMRKQAGPQSPHLVRNMIFELTQGADADPDYAAKLITLPVRPFGALNAREEEAYQESSAMRKLRHAHLAASLILEQHARLGEHNTTNNPATQLGNHGSAGDDLREFGCLTDLWAKGKNNLPERCGRGDADLEALVQCLNLLEVAQIWNVLWSRLIVSKNGKQCQMLNPNIPTLIPS